MMSSEVVQKIYLDERSTKILLAAINRSRSALEISEATGVPIASVCSRLRIMTRRGWMTVDAYRYDVRGREIPLYRSMLSDPLVFVDRGRLRATFQLVVADQEGMSLPGEALL